MDSIVNATSSSSGPLDAGGSSDLESDSVVRQNTGWPGKKKGGPRRGRPSPDPTDEESDSVVRKNTGWARSGGGTRDSISMSPTMSNRFRDGGPIQDSASMVPTKSNRFRDGREDAPARATNNTQLWSELESVKQKLGDRIDDAMDRISSLDRLRGAFTSWDRKLEQLDQAFTQQFSSLEARINDSLSNLDQRIVVLREAVKLQIGGAGGEDRAPVREDRGSDGSDGAGRMALVEADLSRQRLELDAMQQRMEAMARSVAAAERSVVFLSASRHSGVRTSEFSALSSARTPLSPLRSPFRPAGDFPSGHHVGKAAATPDEISAALAEFARGRPSAASSSSEVEMLGERLPAPPRFPPALAEGSEGSLDLSGASLSTRDPAVFGQIRTTHV